MTTHTIKNLDLELCGLLVGTSKGYSDNPFTHQEARNILLNCRHSIEYHKARGRHINAEQYTMIALAIENIEGQLNQNLEDLTNKQEVIDYETEELAETEKTIKETKDRLMPPLDLPIMEEVETKAPKDERVTEYLEERKEYAQRRWKKVKPRNTRGPVHYSKTWDYRLSCAKRYLRGVVGLPLISKKELRKRKSKK